MGSRDQHFKVSGTTTAQDITTIPEGYLKLVTSADNVLAFSGPAERFAYQNNPANATQLGKSRGEGNFNGK